MITSVAHLFMLTVATAVASRPWTVMDEAWAPKGAFQR